MKTNLTITDSNPKGLMLWYTWTETCDKCGATIQEVGDWKHSEKPNMAEKDYCIKCLMEYIDSPEFKVGGLK
jgi:hypothetical protein